MANKQIQIVIKNGKIDMEVLGVSDASCSDLTQALSSALGTVEDVQHKPEFYVELDGIKQEIHES